LRFVNDDDVLEQLKILDCEQQNELCCAADLTGAVGSVAKNASRRSANDCAII
jgi:hypothetical protein